MRVLQVNVRLSEGGAARVQQNLHDRLLDAGHESVIAYGYGPGGRAASGEEEVGTTRLATRNRAGVNLLVHRVIGLDVVPPGRRQAAGLRRNLEEADVVHLHAVHSHFLPLQWLVVELAAAGKPVVWTVHDDWLVTGRCAIAGECKAWAAGCGDCGFRRAYPATTIDLSRREARRRREAVSSISRLTLVAPSERILHRLRAVYPDARLELVRHGLDQPFEQAVRSSAAPRRVERPTPDRPLVVVAADLSQAGKVDQQLLAELAGRRVPILLVGSHPPVSGPSVEHLPAVRDRRALAATYARASALLFTSAVDSFGLVLVEALAVGVPVVATAGGATGEVLLPVNGKPVARADIPEIATRKVWHGIEPGVDGYELRARALSAYSGERMLREYLSIYRDIVA